MELPEVFFETLSFGELKVGERFISMPLPGDNSGHGGFRGSSWLFKKTDDVTAMNVSQRVPSGFPSTMHVLRVI